jgi:hypothetical protein
MLPQMVARVRHGPGPGGTGPPSHRDAVGLDQFVRQLRFERACFGHRQFVAGYGRLAAEPGKALGKPRVVTLDGHEQARRGIDAQRRQLLEQAVLLPALDGGFEIGGDVAGARVQQAVVAARCASAQVDLVDQHAVDATQCEVAHDARAGDAAADDQDLGVQMGRGAGGAGVGAG